MARVEVTKHYRSDPDDKTKQTDEFLEWEFKVGNNHWYRDDLDVGELTGKMLNNGFEYPEVQPAINEIIRQMAEINAPPDSSPGNAPAAKGKGKTKPDTEDETKDSDDPPASP